MILKMYTIRFSKDYFSTYESCMAWLDMKNIKVTNSDEVENYFIFYQVAKERFQDNSLQEYKLDNGVMTEIGMLKENQDETMNTIGDTEISKPIQREEYLTQDEIRSMKEQFQQLKESFNNMISGIASIVKPYTGEIINKSEYEENVNVYVPIVKADERRIVYGEVLVPDEVDGQGHTYSSKEVEDAAHYWMKEFQQVGEMHKNMLQENQIQILESYLAPVTFKFEDGDYEVKKGSWLLKVYVADDELWEKAKTGEFGGFSIGGVATVEDVK